MCAYTNINTLEIETYVLEAWDLNFQVLRPWVDLWLFVITYPKFLLYLRATWILITIQSEMKSRSGGILPFKKEKTIRSTNLGKAGIGQIIYSEF